MFSISWILNPMTWDRFSKKARFIEDNITLYKYYLINSINPTHWLYRHVSALKNNVHLFMDDGKLVTKIIEFSANVLISFTLLQWDFRNKENSCIWISEPCNRKTGLKTSLTKSIIVMAFTRARKVERIYNILDIRVTNISYCLSW